MSTDEEQPDLRPRPSPIFDEPTTPDTCRADYDAAEDIRTRLDLQQGSTH
ncbi:hypothetical protein OG897_06275 [Streptomyces sp. NBC_00237]|nr:hypothetical protein [Streptomyces sp. NBC_00237]MCX5201068.1 hypothetical protein [Streptomyces sp. NBC_00237]